MRLHGLLLMALLLVAPGMRAETREVINARVEEALAVFAKESPAGVELIEKASGVLVFPRVMKAGFGIGGEYGEGSLMLDGEPVAYYSTAGASFGLQLGAQFKSQLILFMNDSALRKFRKSKGWEAGVDGSVAVAKVGAGGSIDSATARKPIIGFIFSNKGLMYNLTLEGSKFTEIER
jgi:lipid-binding SYLF domain-containing protein